MVKTARSSSSEDKKNKFRLHPATGIAAGAGLGIGGSIAYKKYRDKKPMEKVAIAGFMFKALRPLVGARKAVKTIRFVRKHKTAFKVGGGVGAMGILGGLGSGSPRAPIAPRSNYGSYNNGGNNVQNWR